MNEKWDLRFLELARHISGWSKDPSTQTGAVIVDSDSRVVSTGYNGFARGVVDSSERLNDRETKYKMVVHCERNAVIFARQDLRDCTLYTWPFMSCGPCAAMMIQAGIKTVVAPPNDNPRWQADFELAKEMFKEAGVAVRLVGGQPAEGNRTTVEVTKPFDNHSRVPDKCAACGRMILLRDLFVEDGCPCNSPRGVNFEPKSCRICKEYCSRPGHRLRELFGEFVQTDAEMVKA
jgi:dCMP deaminase